ncbi:hypothetical protein GXW77_17390 [Roseomonas alkaliterrae]|uniref:hypothetical protein n=1 Tax=Neoroseomonas alkaliterrae TaxID=1452450 RepID=UPI001BA5A14F|nr:hypothetical protein [Neoroseomonas alkaliterrae]MBR0677951.1 hypothetical protein [Neoroseomonas alkaliterrae]
MSGLTRAQLRAAVVEGLRTGVPGLGGRVFPLRAWPLQMAQMPAALVYDRAIRRTSLARALGAPTYRTLVTFVLVLRAEGASEADVTATLDALSGAAEAALLSSPAFMALAEEIPDIALEREIQPEAERLVGQDAMQFDMQFTEVFDPAGLPDFTEARLTLDAIDPFDRDGPHPPIVDFPPPAAPPRRSGPDGRAEAEIRITYPQP